MKLILIGIISGIVTGMGMGGGSILILILTAFMGVNQHTAQDTNLIFFIPTSISAIYVYFKNKNVDTRSRSEIIIHGNIRGRRRSILDKVYRFFKFKKIFWIIFINCSNNRCYPNN